jgi:hypothetical protein
VIDAGHGVEHNERTAVDGAAHNAPAVSVQNRNSQTGDQGNHSETCPYDVGYEIEYFLSPGIVGELAVR